MKYLDTRLSRAATRAVLRDVSALKSVRMCRVKVLPGASAVRLRMADGVAHFAGLMTCGSTWSCPDCAAKIRDARGKEVEQAFGRHLRDGGGAYFVTLTAQHFKFDRADALVKMVSDSFRALMSGGAATREKKRLGMLGHVRAFEVTHGVNGFHPHLHLLIATERPLTKDELAMLEGRWRPTWARLLVKHGGRAVGEQGFNMSPAKSGGKAIAAYLTKIQGGVERTRGLGFELARGDLKKGRYKTRGMFDVLASFVATGDLDELAVWNEYEQATKGKSAVRWSQGLRERLGAGEEVSDEELAAAEVEGSVDVLTIGEKTWQAVMRTRVVRGADAKVLREAERGYAAAGNAGAAAAVLAYLLSIGIPDPWVREWDPVVEQCE